MKKKLLAITLAFSTIFTAVGCGNKEGAIKNNNLKVGMVTDAGTIDDKSFNQGTWEGISKAKKELPIECTYVKPNGEVESDYLTEIGNLYDAGFKFIITPGFKFESAIYSAQNKYPDAKFVLIDGTPNDGGENSKVGENTVSIYFAEHEAGFLAGVATALKLENGLVGFIGGAEVPAVQKYNWGFQQGIQYANENLGTNIIMDKDNFIYEGSFDNVEGGRKIANEMYNRGVDLIFVAAGGTGVGAIQEAVERAKKGEDVWIIGVDTDQYDLGIYEDGKSVVLTSAVKKLSRAALNLIEDDLKGEFKGGQSITFTTNEDCIGIPIENPNLSEETIEHVNKILEKIKNGEIIVSGVQGDLIP